MEEEVVGYFDKGHIVEIAKGELDELFKKGYTFEEIQEMYAKKGINLKNLKKSSGTKKAIFTDNQMKEVQSKLNEQGSQSKETIFEEGPQVKIINAEGTSDDEHLDNTTTWKEYWEKRTGMALKDILPQKGNKYQCPTHSHHEEGDDGYVEEGEICGCHVQIVDANGEVDDTKMFIAPMCSGCNQRKDIFRLPKKALVPLQPIKRK